MNFHEFSNKCARHVIPIHKASSPECMEKTANLSFLIGFLYASYIAGKSVSDTIADYLEWVVAPNKDCVFDDISDIRRDTEND